MFRKLTLALCALVLMCTPVAAKTLVVAGNCAFPPMEFLTDKKVPTGYSIDLKRYGTRDWGWYMAFGILAILCSLLILWQPAIGALYAVYMISFTFLIIGLFRVMLSFELKNLHKRK